MGDQMLGMITAGPRSQQSLVSAFGKANSFRPDFVSLGGYGGMHLIYEALKRTAGNSDGDLQMLQYTTIAHGRQDTTPRFGMIVHHTDADREWAYDRKSHIGQLDKVLDEAGPRGWVVVDMKTDWSRIYPGSGK